MKSIRLKKVFDIRWLSRKEAIEAVVKSYSALTVFFGEEADSGRDPLGTARGLYKHLTKYTGIGLMLIDKKLEHSIIV